MAAALDMRPLDLEITFTQNILTLSGSVPGAAESDQVGGQWQMDLRGAPPVPVGATPASASPAAHPSPPLFPDPHGHLLRANTRPDTCGSCGLGNFTRGVECLNTTHRWT